MAASIVGGGLGSKRKKGKRDESVGEKTFSGTKGESLKDRRGSRRLPIGNIEIRKKGDGTSRTFNERVPLLGSKLPKDQMFDKGKGVIYDTSALGG